MMRGTYQAMFNADCDRERDERRARKYPELLSAAKTMRDALQYIWDADDMGWITEGDGLFECGQCNSSKHKEKLLIEHEEGCVQGVMAKAINAYDELS